MKRIVTGKPVFDMQNQPTQVPAPAPVPVPSAPTAPRGPKVLPQVSIEQVRCTVNGANMECECDIRNNSDRRVLMDNINFLGKNVELERYGMYLNPGEKREYPVYSGPRPTNTYAKEVTLRYREESEQNRGDYFATKHNLEFRKEADGTYTVSRIYFIPPVRDV
ncbi:MAG: hypothetical protein ACREGJ_00730 [Candidatus Saccharimonadales bacterium]